MKNLLIFIPLFFLLFSVNAKAQKYFTRSGKVSFFSEAPLENIEAQNSKAVSIIELETGRVEFAILIKAFQFEKALMQEHFNENYMESSKYPKATFKGYISNLATIHFNQDGTYNATVKGEMTIHGEKQAFETTGIITISNGNISIDTNFQITVADYKIEIPQIVRENIAKVIAVKAHFDYEKYKS